MELSLILANKILSLFIFLLIGFIAVRAKLLKSEDSTVLSMLNMYVFCPLMIINSFQIEKNEAFIHDIFVVFAVAAVLHVLFILLTMLIRKPLKLSIVEQVSVEYPNLGNLVIPLTIAMFGNEKVVFTLPFIMVTNILIWSHMISLMRGERKPEFKKIVTNVNIIAIVLSFTFFALDVRFPTVIKDVLQSATDMIGPVSMLITGMILGGRNLRETFLNKRAYLVSAIRLVFMPLVFLVLFKVFRLDSLVYGGQSVMIICFLGVCSASGATIVSMAQVFKREPYYAGAINVITTILSIITIPVMITLYQLFV